MKCKQKRPKYFSGIFSINIGQTIFNSHFFLKVFRVKHLECKMTLKMDLEGKLLQILTTFPEKYSLCNDLAISNFDFSKFQQKIMTS